VRRKGHERGSIATHPVISRVGATLFREEGAGALGSVTSRLFRGRRRPRTEPTMAREAWTTNTRDLPPDPPGYQVDDLIVELAPRRVRRAGTLIRLQALSFDLLVALVRAAPNLVSFEQLTERVWPGLVISPETIVQRVKLVRGALGDDPHAPRYIEGVRGRGYRMVAEVRPLTEIPGTPQSVVPPLLTETKVEESPGVHAGIAAVGVAAPDSRSPGHPPPRPGRGLLLGWMGGTLSIVALLAVSWAIVYHRGAGKPAERVSSGTGPAAIHSLAVLPLENLSGDKEQEYFADGMTDEVITELGKIGALRVISRTSAMQFKGAHEPLRDIARKLSVDAIVEGTVLRSGDRVRISAQLIEASSDRHLWAHSYERDLKDVLLLQDEVSRDIAEEVRIKLTPRERSLLSEAHGIDPEAHDDYLRGRYWCGQFTMDGSSKCRAYFQKAIARDPKFALAYAGVAGSYIGQLNCCGLPVQEAFPEAKKSVSKALALDPSLAEAHTGLAIVKLQYDWDWSGSEDEVSQAIVLNPNYEPAHSWYSVVLLVMGRFDEAVKEAERAQDLDPFSIPLDRWMVEVFYHSRRYDEALREARRLSEMHPGRADGYRDLGDLYEQMKKFPEAFAAYQQQLNLLGDKSADALGEAYRRSGYKGYLLKKIQILEQTPHFDMYTGPILAREYAQLGDETHAMFYLERAYDEHYPWLLLVRVAPEWDPIRSSPRFRELVRRLGLPPTPNDRN
jgi:TolB-like protein/DNA-binding winged helix-turn-helix (wHTH) protein/tetratricopeptide (TPR) repeat protein